MVGRDEDGLRLARGRGGGDQESGADGARPVAERLLEGAAVVVGPGAAYGPSSDGYVRMSLTAPEERLAEALDRIARAL